MRLASRIVGSASRMSAVIDAMLAFSRSGLLPRGRTEVRSAVTEALEDLGTVAGGAEVVLQLEEATVACAPEVLGQILRNVMGNALKYRVPERPCRLEVSTRVETFSVTVEVVDNGQGMEPEAARRAFEPFFRGTAEGSGHGLGLAIVDSYVRALGGSVQLRSELGVGTRVSLRLPRMPPGGGGHARPTRAAAPGPPAAGHRNLSGPTPQTSRGSPPAHLLARSAGD